MAVIIGTSGWQYRDWRGRFYPPGLPGLQPDPAHTTPGLTTTGLPTTGAAPGGTAPVEAEQG